MYIDDKVLDILINSLTLEYHGCHSPDSTDPLWGRCAYWRVYYKDKYYAKITTPVKVLEPSKKQLKTLFKKELKKRIDSIGYTLDVNSYLAMSVVVCDPYSLKGLVEDVLCGKFIDIDFPKDFERIYR
jgi:hypothetical protein